jgi:hypothetical protein
MSSFEREDVEHSGSRIREIPRNSVKPNPNKKVSYQLQLQTFGRAIGIKRMSSVKKSFTEHSPTQKLALLSNSSQEQLPTLPPHKNDVYGFKQRSILDSIFESNQDHAPLSRALKSQRKKTIF